jgi:hypothetical protein
VAAEGNLLFNTTNPKTAKVYFLGKVPLVKVKTRKVSGGKTKKLTRVFFSFLLKPKNS